MILTQFLSHLLGYQKQTYQPHQGIGTCSSHLRLTLPQCAIVAGDLEKRLADAVQGIAATPVGEETKTFLDVEDTARAVSGSQQVRKNT